jgi:catechol 2,3-dioxygenase-like lactoylglutathione lyase family enzyme
VLNKLGFVILKVRDMKQSLHFFRDLLGFKVDFEMDGFVMFKTSNSSFCLEQLENPQQDKKQGLISFEIEHGVNDLYQNLKKRNVKIVQAPTNMEWGGRLVTLLDPDGNEIGFYEILGPLCESCGMPMNSLRMRGGGIESNPYCAYCCDVNGELKSRKDVRDSMVKFYMNERGVGLKEAEKKVDELMKWLPAWKDYQDKKNPA